LYFHPTFSDYWHAEVGDQEPRRSDVGPSLIGKAWDTGKANGGQQRYKRGMRAFGLMFGSLKKKKLFAIFAAPSMSGNKEA
jgi:hypothetical protein